MVDYMSAKMNMNTKKLTLDERKLQTLLSKEKNTIKGKILYKEYEYFLKKAPSIPIKEVRRLDIKGSVGDTFSTIYSSNCACHEFKYTYVIDLCNYLSLIFSKSFHSNIGMNEIALNDLKSKYGLTQEDLYYYLTYHNEHLNLDFLKDVNMELNDILNLPNVSNYVKELLAMSLEEQCSIFNVAPEVPIQSIPNINNLELSEQVSTIIGFKLLNSASKIMSELFEYYFNNICLDKKDWKLISMGFSSMVIGSNVENLKEAIIKLDNNSTEVIYPIKILAL